MKTLNHEVELRKEIFVRYGSAMYHAQCMEKSLVLLVAAVFSKDYLSSNPDKREEFFSETFSKTLSHLFHRLQNQFAIDPNFEEKLINALRKKNWFAHNYFYERASDLLGGTGLICAVQELTVLCQLFEDVDNTLTAICNRWREKYGFDEGVVDAELKKFIQESEKGLTGI